MKKMILLAALVCSVVAMAQQPVITFEKTTHDFGKINEADGRVTTVFEFTNEGMVPLVLTNVRASCGCTTPKWTREPIEPGQKGTITVTYNPNGRPGRFQKTVTVTSNATEATTSLSGYFEIACALSCIGSILISSSPKKSIISVSCPACLKNNLLRD